MSSVTRSATLLSLTYSSDSPSPLSKERLSDCRAFLDSSRCGLLQHAIPHHYVAPTIGDATPREDHTTDTKPTPARPRVRTHVAPATRPYCTR
jgi:hypothetical protein